MSKEAQWWKDLLEERAAEGRLDARFGYYRPPRPEYSGNPLDEAENQAYRSGFQARNRRWEE